MAVDFHGHPMFPSTGFNAPTRFEADIYDCEVWGKIPSDIEGNGDGPAPSRTVVMFPRIAEAPYHYANSVSGRTVLSALPSIEEQLRLYPMPAAGGPPGAGGGAAAVNREP